MLPCIEGPASVDIEKRQVELTFRSGESSRSVQSLLRLSDLVIGSKLDGTVKKIEDYGLFIELEGSKLRGLCHKSEVYTQFIRQNSFLNISFSSLTTRMPMSLWPCAVSEKKTMSRL